MTTLRRSLIYGLLVLVGLLAGTVTAHADSWQKCAAKPDVCPYFFDVYARDKAFRNAFNEALRRSGIRKPGWINNATATPAEPAGYSNDDRFLFYVCEPHNCSGHFFYVIYEPRRSSLRGLQVIDNRQTVVGDLSLEEKNLLISKMK